MTPKKLYRSRTDRVLAGVAGGIAEYFAIDPIIIRLLFVLLAIAGGPGIVLYIIAWIIIPEAPEVMVEKKKEETKTRDIGEEIEAKAKTVAKDVQESTEAFSRSPERKHMAGLVILAVGIIFLIENVTGFSVWRNLWPLLIIAIGLGLIIRGTHKESV